MPRLVHRLPAYRKHSTGQAFVRLNGKHIYLGTYGSDGSRANYDAQIREWLRGCERLTTCAMSTEMLQPRA